MFKARLLRNNGVTVAVKEITQSQTSEAELSEFHHEIWMMRFDFSFLSFSVFPISLFSVLVAFGILMWCAFMECVCIPCEL